jgi:hypothetical protein
LVYDIAVHTVLTLTIFRTFNPIRETRTILFVAFRLLASTKLTFVVLLDHFGAVLEMFNSFGPLLGVDNIPAAFTLTERGANSIVSHALAGGFDALSDFAMTELPPICHLEGIFHLYAGITTGFGDTNLCSGRIAGTLLTPTGGVAVTGMTLGVFLV